MGRRHRPFFRVCAVDARAPRDGRVIEELGTYDPMVPETDARAILNGERIDYWLSVGAQPTPKTKVLIRKYGTNGTHLEQQREAIERLGARRSSAIEAALKAAAAAPKPQVEPEPAAAEPAAAETEGESTSADAAAEPTGNETTDSTQPAEAGGDAESTDAPTAEDASETPAE